MALLTKIEAAIKMGVGVELVEYFMKYNAKPGLKRKLKFIKSDIGPMIEESELFDYLSYLREPWPLKNDKDRPSIPAPISNDVKIESHHACAICGHMDNGEVAHIEAVSATLNNSPDNLIYLCPNHHTKYDYGFKTDSNLTLEEIRAAKLIKRQSRIRVFRYEEKATKNLYSLIKLLEYFKEEVEKDPDSKLSTVYLTEADNLLKSIPELAKKAHKGETTKTTTSKTEQTLADKAPNIASYIKTKKTKKTSSEIMSEIANVSAQTEEIFFDLDEVECPHCNGRGTTGLVGDFCIYCHGSCVVSEEKSEEYDPDDLDEMECPHCKGRGTTGLIGDICSFCHGSCVVSEEKSEEYDPNDLYEVECPHCKGRGTTGLTGDICSFCHGSCVVSEEKAEEYDPDDLDEVECPHCKGRGTTGLTGDICSFCHGSCVVSEEKAEEYDPDDLDEVECPHCKGRGTTGLVSDICSYCHGSCVVSEKKAEEYDPDDLDEVECPHCKGRGTTGLVGDFCKVCKGSCVVTDKIFEAYVKKYRSKY